MQLDLKAYDNAVAQRYDPISTPWASIFLRILFIRFRRLMFRSASPIKKTLCMAVIRLVKFQTTHRNPSAVCVRPLIKNSKSLMLVHCAMVNCAVSKLEERVKYLDIFKRAPRSLTVTESAPEPPTGLTASYSASLETLSVPPAWDWVDCSRRCSAKRLDWSEVSRRKNRTT